jgi:hypothetical protein
MSQVSKPLARVAGGVDDDVIDKVTWLLPVLNGGNYLEHCLLSIERQSYTNFEVLAWDNGSVDGSKEVLESWIPARLPGRVVVHRPLSLGKCLATLVEMASTSLCARMDADDVCEPDRLEKQVSFLRAHRHVVAVGSQVRRLGPNGALGGLHHFLPLEHEDIVLRLLRQWSMWHPSVLFRREAVLAAGNYGDEKPAQDYGLWLRLARVGRLANLADALVQYRVHAGSVTSEFTADAASHARACVIQYGPTLYGCSSTELETLLDNRAPHALVIYLKLLYSLFMQKHVGKRALAVSTYLRQEVRQMVRQALYQCRHAVLLPRSWRGGG